MVLLVVLLAPDTAVLFPGQGVAVAGARDFAHDVLPRLVERASELVGDDPFERASESTRFAQPAIFLASLAGWETIEGYPPLALAGHSLGELSALAAAGALSHDGALSVVVLRGRLMADAAAAAEDGGMLAVLKGTPGDAREIAARFRVWVANDNAPGQTVLSGPRAALRGAAEMARAMGLRAIILDVAGAFHSPDMAAAEASLLAALSQVDAQHPRVPVFSGLTAAPFINLPFELSRALTRPVRWRETMTALHNFGAARFVDAGPDQVLARLVARNLAGAPVHMVEESRGIRA